MTKTAKVGRPPLAPQLRRRWRGPSSLDDVIETLAMPRFSYADALDLIERATGHRPDESWLRGLVNERREELGLR